VSGSSTKRSIVNGLSRKSVRRRQLHAVLRKIEMSTPFCSFRLKIEMLAKGMRWKKPDIRLDRLPQVSIGSADG